MVFSSQIFLFWFLPWVLLLLWVAPRSLRNLLLTICSYVFYGWTNPIFVLLMFGSTLVDYCCGLALVSAVEGEGEGEGEGEVKVKGRGCDCS